MEEVKLKKSKMPSLKDVINYRDFFGEYPIIFAIKIISSLALIYVITEFYSYHSPLDSLITKHMKSAVPGFSPDPKIFVIWGFITGFGLYFFTLFRGKYKFLLFI